MRKGLSPVAAFSKVRGQRFPRLGRPETCELCRAQASTTYQRPTPSRRQPDVTDGSGQLVGRPSSSLV